MLTLFLVAVLVLAFCYIFFRSYNADKNLEADNLPPGTMGWPFIGETLEFAKKKVQFFKDRHVQYGRIYKTSLFGKNIIRVCGAENVRKITLGENKIVQSSYPASVVKLLSNDSISMMNGEEHHSRKQQLQKYLSPEYLRNHVPILASKIAERLQTWCDMSEVDLHKECRKLFVELATKFLVKIDIEDDDIAAVQEALDTFNENIFSLPVNIPGFGFHKSLKAKNTLKEIITDVFNKPSLNNNNESDELASLLEGLRASKDDKIDISKEDQLLNATIELLFSGSETVSSSGFSLIYNLIKSPKVLEKLSNEVKRQELSNPSESLCAHDIQEMTYLQAVMKESLRQAPAIGGGYRTVVESFDLEGYTIPKGWSVVFSIRETHHRDPSVSDPLTFNPDQWLEPSFSPDKYSYVPFGAGPRTCPGQAYAKLILKLFAVEFARTCKAEIIQDSEINDWPTPRPVDKVLVKFQRI